MIVFNSFCDSTVAGVWTRCGAAPLLITALLTGALLAVILTMTSFVATRLKFDVEDEIAAVFCGSKKSLAAGAPMAALIFGSGGTLGLRSEEHTSELQSLMRISYAVFCLKTKKNI